MERTVHSYRENDLSDPVANIARHDHIDPFERRDTLRNIIRIVQQADPIGARGVLPGASQMYAEFVEQLERYNS